MAVMRAGTAVLLTLWIVAGCAGLPRRAPSEPPLRLSELADQGDGRRRASLRLVLEGLDADHAGNPARALDRYELALQVDSTNPYAYLALARHHAEGPEPRRARGFLEQARAQLDAQGVLSPGVLVHLIGIEGEIEYASGDFERGMQDLAYAGELAPTIWGDGHLSAAELR